MDNEKKHLDPTKRHEAVYLFDVVDGNPNGDMDAGNQPRVDDETGHGLVTDMCLKRHIRDWIGVFMRGKEGYNIHVASGVCLNDNIDLAYKAESVDPSTLKTADQLSQAIERTQRWMCKHFFDVRGMGAVLATGNNAGRVTGPFQFTFARSIDPIHVLDCPISRVCVARPEDRLTKAGKLKETELGRKSLTPYGLYRATAFFTPHYAEQTGVTSQDLEVVWEALVDMWAVRRSAAKGLMGCRGLYIFSHDKPRGCARAQDLVERITVQMREGVTAPRHFKDYEVVVDDADLPEGVTLTRIVG